MASLSLIFRFADVEVCNREFSLMKAAHMLPVEPKAFRVLLIMFRNPQELIEGRTVDEIVGVKAL